MATIGAAVATALAPQAATAPDSFLELWADRGDVLGGDHGPIYEKFKLNINSAQFHKATLEGGSSVPSVCLCGDLQSVAPMSIVWTCNIASSCRFMCAD